MRLIREGASYGAVGLIQLGIDWLAFVLLTRFGVLVALANLIARVAGASAGFWLNRHWTFRAGHASGVPRHASRFAIWWILTTVASTCVVSAASRLDGLHSAWLVKPAIDVVLAGCGFLVSKYWIYK